MAVTFLMLIVFGLILFVIMGNNIEPKPQICHTNCAALVSKGA